MVFTCPNNQCGYNKALKEGETCPECGEIAQNFGFRDSIDLYTQKERFKKGIAKASQQTAKAPIEEPNTTPQAPTPNNTQIPTPTTTNSTSTADDETLSFEARWGFLCLRTP